MFYLAGICVNDQGALTNTFDDNSCSIASLARLVGPLAGLLVELLADSLAFGADILSGPGGVLLRIIVGSVLAEWIFRLHSLCPHFALRGMEFDSAFILSGMGKGGRGQHGLALREDASILKCAIAHMRYIMYPRCMKIVAILSALAEPTRLAALSILWDGGEHRVCELMEKLGATQSRMSRHMGVLKTAGLVTDRRDAQWVRYRRNPNMPPDETAVIDAVMVAASRHEREAA